MNNQNTKSTRENHSEVAIASIWLLLLALVVVAAVLLWRNARQRRVEADALLWQEIDAHVSRQVPAPLEPLMKLVAWEPVSSKGEAQ
ncbi:MAG: hypothetical protein LAQ30_24910 [Acidobacteriia bacterium]|nr:hypothetical protein [Terriglobia bacterium]